LKVTPACSCCTNQAAYFSRTRSTPGKQTFAFFRQNLVSDYTYPESVADGVNVDFDVYPRRPRRSSTNAVGAVFEIVGQWALARIYSGYWSRQIGLVQTNGCAAMKSRITVTHSSPKRRGMSNTFGISGMSNTFGINGGGSRWIRLSTRGQW
jgi:hypothetical protein